MSNYKISIYPYMTCNYPNAEILVETKEIAVAILEFLEDHFVLAEVRDIEPKGPLHWMRSNYPNPYAVASYNAQSDIEEQYKLGNKKQWRELFVKYAKYGNRDVLLNV